MPRPNIGEVHCPLCNEFAAVRKKTTGKMYVFCGDCGMLGPSLATGQQWIAANMVPIGATSPEWIRQGRAWKYSSEEELARGRPGGLESVIPHKPKPKKTSVLDDIL